jgi:hypothetical protein
MAILTTVAFMAICYLRFEGRVNAKISGIAKSSKLPKLKIRHSSTYGNFGNHGTSGDWLSQFDGVGHFEAQRLFGR